MGSKSDAKREGLLLDKKLPVSVIICTKNRPEECLRALKSVCIQSIGPQEIIVVDGSSTKELEELVRSITDSHCVPCKYLKTKPQLTYQRNRGISHMTGDVGLFIDDDVILYSDYIEKILEAYANEPDVGGVAGTVCNVQPPTWIKVFRSCFLLWHRYGNGRMRASGYGTYVFRPQKPQEVEIFEGCNMSYTKDVLGRFRFDERIDVTGGNEDIDFSYRVSKKHRLIQTPFARVLHNQSGNGRYDLSVQCERAIYWHYYFFRKNMPKTWTNIVAYTWSNLGNLIGAVKRAITARTIEPLVGVIRGYMRVFGEIKINKRTAQHSGSR